MVLAVYIIDLMPQKCYNITILVMCGDYMGYVIILILVLLNIFRIPLKGYIGELKVRRILKELPERDYFVMNNLLIKNGNGTTQIDHVIASIYGIFVIETKNYTGSIYGNENFDDWIKYILKKKYKFYNPIKQNYAHICALKNRFPALDNSKFISIIAFSDNVKLNVTATRASVVNYSNLINAILSHTEKINTYNDMYMIRQILNDEDETSIKNSIAHIERVNEKILNNTIKNNNKYVAPQNKYVCPKCGGELEYHPKGRYGAYYKCTACKININKNKLTQ